MVAFPSFPHSHDDEGAVITHIINAHGPSSASSQTSGFSASRDVEKQDDRHTKRASADGHDYSVTTDALSICQLLAAPAPSTSSDLTFPEGGLAGWLVVVGAFCAMLCVFGLINSSAVFESYFAAHQLAEYSPSQRGWVFSLNLFCVFFLGLQVGPVYDRFGPRVPVALGSILVVGSLFLLGFCTSEYPRDLYQAT
jgi:hypothetical protein